MERFNGKEIGENLAHLEMLSVAEYMIKEAWPSYLQASYCTRMTYDLTPETTGNHTLAISTTGISNVFINDELIFHRPQQEKMRMEEFYFYKVQLERRFTFSMIAGQKYHIRVESWATEPETLAAVSGWIFQGATLRYFEFVDIPASIQRAAKIAAESDYAVVCIGTSSEIESEGYDRETLELIGEQYTLVRAVVAANPNTIVANFSGAPVNLEPCLGAMAIIQAWFPGQECEISLAKVLTSKVNPGGRLPFSWPKRLEDNPSYGNFPAGEDLFLRYEEGIDVGYRYYEKESNPDPLFPFRFGLSYTTFSISGSQISSSSVLQGCQGTIEITSSIGNIGTKSGKCAVQYYVQFPDTRIGQSRPFKELKAFTKIEVEASESKISKVVLDKYSVSFYDSERACWFAQKGKYTVHICFSVADIVNEVRFEVAEDFTWTGV
jgi:beta-glucosidase